MRRRPLCLAAVLLLLALWILPKDVWLKQPDIPSGEKILITGRVVKREQKEDSQVYYLKKCLCEQTDSKFSVLAYIQKGTSYPVGCELSLYGTIYQLSQADNPGQFDQESFYQSQGILYTFWAEHVASVQGGSFFREKITRLREYLGQQLMIIFDERDGGILKAVLLGDKSSLREEDRMLYQKNGISHLLAISGLHVSMIGITLYKLLRRCNLTFGEAGVPSGILLLIYGMMTGFGISTIRAVCMFLVMIFGEIFGRTYDMASAMGLAALILLIRNPLQARQAGFLLSFGAVLGVCVVYPVLQSSWKPKGRIARTFLFSISLSLITYPISVHFYYEYPLYSILLNLIVIPCMPFAMVSAGVAVASGCVFPAAGKIFGIPAHLVLSLYEVLGEWVMTLPKAVICLGCEKPWQLIAYYILLLIGLLSLWYGRRRIYGVFLPLALVVITLRFRSGMQFTMLDVGQGDGLFLRFPGGTTCLIDGGSVNVKNPGKYRILPYLKYEGVSKLDYVIFTHLDEDHISGVRELLELCDTPEGIKIGCILFPEISNPDDDYLEIWNHANEKEIPTGTIGAGDKIREEDLLMECLYPVKGSFTEDKNNSSTVLLLSYREFSILLTGDLGFEGEQQLIQNRSLKGIDVWKVSHHGSKYSGGDNFLEIIKPGLSLISVGKNNYGHPSPELMERLEKIGSQTETTFDHGALMLESDGHIYSLTFGR